jgi:methylmalonyl-CoA/ethylmalonyl-CoA epimerase
MNNSIKFHHFGLAVKTFENALNFYKNLNYLCTSPIIDKQQNVELILCTSKIFPSVELIRPINNRSPITNYLKTSNEITYHTCYEIDNVDDIKFLFLNNRAICRSKPQPAILFENRLVSFYYLPNVGLIEILQNN